MQNENDNKQSSGMPQRIPSPMQKWISMPQLCQQVAARHKNNLALALMGPDACEYYHFLFINSKISQLAAYMHDSGVKPHHRVALHLEKGLETYVAIFAIWRLNAVYCPMPTTLNESDFHYRFCDCQPHFIISMPDHIERHTDFDWMEVKLVDASILDKPCEATLNHEQTPIAPNDPGYMIYTSGTTGQPKGVVIPHLALVSRYESHQRLMGLTPKDTILQYADLRVDVSLMEIWLAWATGACLCVPTGNINTLVHEFPIICHKFKITTMILAPSMLGLFVNDKDFIRPSDAKAFQSIRHIISATEAATESLLNTWRLAGTTRPRRVYNGYGPTETAIGLTICEYIEGPINLGNHNDHFEGVSLYVYRDGELHRRGAGEICAHGEGFSSGYWSNGKHDQAKTEKVFTTLPISGKNEIPVYRTGDQGYFDESGQLFFSGRIKGNQQVKINGSRIELGSIVAHLKSHPKVLDAIAFMNKKTVVAIIQVNQPHQITRQTIRKQFGESGDYNSAFIPKSIRETVSPLDKTHATISESHLIKVDDRPIQEPRNKIETVLRAIWSDLLEYEDLISIDHDFYDLGGYSLLVSQMLMAIEKTFHVSIQLASLTTTSIRTIAEEITLLQIFQKCTQPPNETTNIQPSEHVFVYFPPLAGNSTLKYKQLCGHTPPDFPPSPHTLLIKHPLQCSLLTAKEIDQYKILLPLSIEQEARYLAAGIQHHFKHGNIHCIGWSFGGLMAYAVHGQIKPQDRIKSLNLLDSQAPGEILKLTPKAHHARIKQIITILFREFSCPEPTITNHVSDNHQTCIDTTFRDALEAAAESTDDTKLADMLLTAQHHLSATLEYKPKPRACGIPVYLYRAELSSDGVPDECKPKTWESFAKNLHEYTIERSNHFNLPDQETLTSLLFTNLSHELSNLALTEQMRALSTENFKALSAPTTQPIVDTFPFTLQGEGQPHHEALLTMCIDELYCNPSLESIGLRFHPRFDRKLINAQIQNVIRNRYDKSTRRSFPLTIQLNTIKHQGPITSIQTIKDQIPHFDSIKKLLELKQVIIVVTHLSDDHTINQTVIAWLNKHKAQYVLLSECHENNPCPALIQKELTYEITCSGSDEKAILYENAIASSSTARQHLDRHPELLALMGSPLTATHMLEALQNSPATLHFTNIHHILDTFFTLLWPALCSNNKAHANALHRFCQDMAIRMMIYNQNKLRVQQKPADDWAPALPESCDFIQVHSNDGMLYETIDGFVFQTNGGYGEFIIPLLIPYFSATLLIESSQKDFRILWRMQQAGVKLPPMIFRNTKLLPHLQPHIKALRPLSPTTEGKPPEYSSLAVHFSALSEPSIACAQSHIPELDLRQSQIHNAQITKCRVGTMNLSNAHLNEFSIHDTEITHLHLGTHVLPYPSSFALISYSPFHQQFVACNESGVCLFYPERGKMHTLTKKVGSRITSITSMASSGQICVGTNQGAIYAIPRQSFDDDTITTIPIKTSGMHVRKLWHNEINDHLVSYHIDLESMKAELHLWDPNHEHIDKIPLQLGSELNDIVPLSKMQSLLLAHSGQCFLLESTKYTKIDALSEQVLIQILPYHERSVIMAMNGNGEIIHITCAPPNFEYKIIETPQCTHMAPLDETKVLCLTLDRFVIVVDTINLSIITTHDNILPRHPNSEGLETLCGMRNRQVARLNDGHLQIWDGQDLSDHHQIHPLPRKIHTILTHPSQQQCAIHFADNHIEIHTINPFALCWKYSSDEAILSTFFATDDEDCLIIHCENELLLWNFHKDHVTQYDLTIDEIISFTRSTPAQFTYRVGNQCYQYKDDQYVPTEIMEPSRMIRDEQTQYTNGRLYRWSFHDEQYSQMELSSGKVMQAGETIYPITIITCNSDESITAMGFNNGRIWCFQTCAIHTGRCIDTEFADIHALTLSEDHLMVADSSGRLMIYQQKATQWRLSHQTIPRPWLQMVSSEQTTFDRVARHTFDFFSKRSEAAKDIESALKRSFTKHS